MPKLKETPSQTAGPYVHIGLAPGAAGFDIYREELGHDIAGSNANGDRIRIEGIVLDGNDDPVKDVLIEAWQASAEGHYADDGFRGWGRVISDFDTGAWAFDTVKPGAVIGADGSTMAPHINLWIVARGINIGLNTRLYFDDEGDANAADPILSLVDPTRRDTLIARKQGGVYRFDIRLQDDAETVFFDI